MLEFLNYLIGEERQSSQWASLLICQLPPEFVFNCYCFRKWWLSKLNNRKIKKQIINLWWSLEMYSGTTNVKKQNLMRAKVYDSEPLTTSSERWSKRSQTNGLQFSSHLAALCIHEAGGSEHVHDDDHDNKMSRNNNKFMFWHKSKQAVGNNFIKCCARLVSFIYEFMTETLAWCARLRF